MNMIIQIRYCFVKEQNELTISLAAFCEVVHIILSQLTKLANNKKKKKL